MALEVLHLYSSGGLTLLHTIVCTSSCVIELVSLNRYEREILWYKNGAVH